MENFISWKEHPVPDDIRGIFIKYEDGFLDCDRYDRETKNRKYRDSAVIGWKFMERKDPNEKNIQCHRERTNPEEQFEETFDDYLKDPGRYFHRMEDNLIKELLCDVPNSENK